ncbi:MAG: matrixin family metalloprotease [Pirellulaceae bacterium]|nr:matrixin family metalloprotease [Pirellulaceae bacterium]
MSRTAISLKTAFATTLALAASCLPHCQAEYVTFGQGYGSKWGAPEHGTISEVITWSFMTDGTPLHASHPLLGEVTGTSNISNLSSRFDAGVFEQLIQNAFNTWSAASQGRITFLQVTDNGAPAGGNSLNNDHPGSWEIDIRVGAFTAAPDSDFAWLGAVGYGPPGNDHFPFFKDGLAGDIIFNLSQQFFVAPGNEGDIFYDGTGPYINDLEGLMLHELGHAAIGLGHPSAGVGDVMFVDDFPDCCNFVNRQLSPDDIAGARAVYGVPEPDIINYWPYHVAYSGSGTPPWHRLDAGKTLFQESSHPQLLTYNNLINSKQGINGILFDINNLANADHLGTNDFSFQVSPAYVFNQADHPPVDWQAIATAPTISVSGSAPHRVLINWPDETIMNRWLRVTIKATSNTGLAQPAVFYLGHLLGETTGPVNGVFTVSFADISPIRDAVSGIVDASSVYDIDKNGTISFADITAMRANVSAQLRQITVP